MKLYLDPFTTSFGIDDREALRVLVRRVIRPGCRIIEIGSWLGTGSTQVIIEELLGVPDVKLFCVDTWKGSPNVVRHQQIVSEYDVVASFRRNVSLAGGEGIVRQLIMSSEDAATLSQDQQFDLVFIDGNHSYAQTKSDISLWQLKVRKGGILCGHDCECRPVGELGQMVRAAPDVDAIPGEGTRFSVIHPGVVLAVEEAFSGRAHLWSEEEMQRPDGSVGRATIWDTVIEHHAN